MHGHVRLPRRSVLVAALALAMLASVVTPALAVPQVVQKPDDACPDRFDPNPPSPFTDRGSIYRIHVKNVDCLYNNNISEGFPDGTYRPFRTTSRGEFAIFLVRTLQAAGIDLPAPANPGPSDANGGIAEGAVDTLVAAGIVSRPSDTIRFRPTQALRRDETSSFVLRAAAFAEDVPLANLHRPDGPFRDVPESNIHEEDINGARVLNLTIGYTATTYRPNTLTPRDQMASFLARLLATFTAGPVVPPELRVSSLTLTPPNATNPVNTDHTVTATALEDDGDPVSGALVRFEVYRDDASTGNNVSTGPEETFSRRTNGNGKVTFTYGGPDFAADDQIVGCVVDPEKSDCEVVDEDGSTPGVQVKLAADVGARVDDTADKTWEEIVDRITPDDEDQVAVNPLGSDHTVNVTAFDGNDNPVNNVDLRVEVYRDDTPRDDDDVFSGPIKTATITTNSGGRADFTYTGPDSEASDQIVVCRAVRGTCLVVDEQGDVDGTQIVGDPVVRATPNAVVIKNWTNDVVFAARAANAIADSLDATGTLGDLVDGVVDALADDTTASANIDGPTQDSNEDELLEVPAEPLLDVGILRQFAGADAPRGIAQASTRTANVDLLSVLDTVPLVGDTVGSVLAADAVDSVATARCPGPNDPAPGSAQALRDASEGTRLVGLELFGDPASGDVAPNTTILPDALGGLAQVTLRKVQYIDRGNGEFGYRVIGAQVELLGGLLDDLLGVDSLLDPLRGLLGDNVVDSLLGDLAGDGLLNNSGGILDGLLGDNGLLGGILSVDGATVQATGSLLTLDIGETQAFVDDCSTVPVANFSVAGPEIVKAGVNPLD